MLGLTELYGFGVNEAPLNLTYVGSYEWSSDTEQSTVITFPPGTQAVICTAGTFKNAFATDLLNYVKIDDALMQQQVLAQRADEYRADTSIWCLNVGGGGGKTIKVDKSSATHAARAHFYALTKQFQSYAPSQSDTDIDASDPLDCNIDQYKDGVVVAVWYTNIGAAGFTGNLTVDYLAPSVGVCAASLKPTADALAVLQQMYSGAGGNDGQTACVASWAPGKFI